MTTCSSNREYFYIYGIPRNYRTCHLRNFFSQYVESSGFSCFHFRHRPEVAFEKVSFDDVSCAELVSALNCKSRNNSRLCGFLCLPSSTASEFLRRYQHAHWISVDKFTNEYMLPEQCSLAKVSVTSGNVSFEAFLKLIEFHPPSWMPFGNVGTPTAHFFELIKCCQLDGSVIGKLGLNFSTLGKRRLYGAVPYTYAVDSSSVTECRLVPLPGEVRSRTGTRILTADEYKELSYVESDVSSNQFRVACPSTCMSDEDDSPDSGEEPCEEWERFESLHDDPYKLERRDKANLKYEDKVELVWEKGGSGLLFHTDERTWRKLDPLRKEELFDEPASFDWDIDMEPYETAVQPSVGPTPTGHWGMFRDTANLIDIQRSNEGIEPLSSSAIRPTFCHHKIHEKGYGLYLLKRMGWKPGMPLGNQGSFDPLSAVSSGRSLPPRVRTGLGYYGPRLCDKRSSVLIKRDSDNMSVYIRSVFDSPAHVALRSGLGHAANLLRRNDPHDVIKYRTHLHAASNSIVPSNSDPVIPSRINRTVILTPRSTLSKEGISFIPGGILYPNVQRHPDD